MWCVSGRSATSRRHHAALTAPGPRERHGAAPLTHTVPVPNNHRRPKRQDDLVSIFAAMPWWVLPIVLAAVDGGIVVVANANDLPFSTTKLFIICATVIIGTTGVAGLFEKARLRRLLATTHQLDDLRSLTPLQFEELVLAAYRTQGWSGSLTGRGADGGVDVILERRGEKVFVQCKRWTLRTVPVDAVRALKGSMATEGVARGIFVCCGRFTPEAERYAASSGITVIGGEALLALVRDVTGAVPVPQVAAAEAPPLCPRCQRRMVSRSGPHGGFWGCPQFPNCRGTRQLRDEPMSAVAANRTVAPSDERRR
jgi:restriction system protein